MSTLKLAVILTLVLPNPSSGSKCMETHFKPVCGNNGVRFINACWMTFYSFYNYADIRNGRSSRCNPQFKDCPYRINESCKFGNGPICGYNFKSKEYQTFENVCHFLHDCDCNPDIHFRSCGACGDDLQTTRYNNCLASTLTQSFFNGTQPKISKGNFTGGRHRPSPQRKTTHTTSTYRPEIVRVTLPPSTTYSLGLSPTTLSSAKVISVSRETTPRNSIVLTASTSTTSTTPSTPTTTTTSTTVAPTTSVQTSHTTTSSYKPKTMPMLTSDISSSPTQRRRYKQSKFKPRIPGSGGAAAKGRILADDANAPTAARQEPTTTPYAAPPTTPFDVKSWIMNHHWKNWKGAKNDVIIVWDI